MLDLRVLLHGNMAGTEQERDHAVVHASDLTKPDKAFCPREFALLDETKKQRPSQFIATSMRATFDYGNHLQWCVNNKWMRPFMFGHWKCLTCGRHTTKIQKVPRQRCATAEHYNLQCRFEYVEPRAVCPDTGVSCGLDGLVLDGKKLRAIEVKTEVKDEFKELVAPRSEHRQRCALYLRVVASDPGLSKIVHTDSMRLLYVCKGYGVKDDALKAKLKDHDIGDWGFSPFKEYEVERSDDEIAPLLKRAMAVKYFRAGGGMPEGVCSSLMSKRAKECSMRGECFSGCYPAELEWKDDGDQEG